MQLILIILSEPQNVIKILIPDFSGYHGKFQDI